MATPTLWPMPGGISPKENKRQSLTGLIKTPPLPPSLHIQVSQPHLTQTPDILVKVGEKVLKGQTIARGSDAHGLAFHAPSSGTVSSIEPRFVPNASALKELCIGINTDGQDQWLPLQGEQNYQTLSRVELLARIAKAGISGLGGAGFPTYSKLCTQQIHTFIINACECEPFITADEALLREHSAEIVTGIQIVLHILQPQRCLIAIEENKAETLQAFKQANVDSRIQLASIPARYPSGSQKQLIQILTGSEISSASHAVTAGIVCLNVGTVYAIGQAITLGKPLISRITTMTGAALTQPCNMEVLIGSSMQFLLDCCGLEQQHLSHLIMGGPLMGITLPQLNLPILKTSNCLLATTAEELPTPPTSQACIRCGLCVEACPVGLLPQQLYWFAQNQEYDKALSHNLMDCIECGACAYVCPSYIPLVQFYRASKASIHLEQNQHMRAQQSRQRFEWQQQRNARYQAEANLRRQKRAALVQHQSADGQKAKGGAAQSAIQAALARAKAKKETN